MKKIFLALVMLVGLANAKVLEETRCYILKAMLSMTL